MCENADRLTQSAYTLYHTRHTQPTARQGAPLFLFLCVFSPAQLSLSLSALSTYHTAVCEHHGPCLQAALPGVRVARDGGGETDARGPAAGGVDGEGGDAEDEAEELGVLKRERKKGRTGERDMVLKCMVHRCLLLIQYFTLTGSQDTRTHLYYTVLCVFLFL